jgi:hypothetical protein
MSDAISVFVSSKQGELDTDRQIVRQRAEDAGLTPVLAEDWPPGRADIRQVYLEKVERCPIYLGLFYRTYSEPTAEEYRVASNNPYREILIYWRSSGGQPVDAPLSEFMRAVGTRHVYQKYQKPEDLLRIVHEHLQQALERMIQLLLNLGKSAKGGHLFGGVGHRTAAHPAQEFLRALNFPDGAYDAAHAQAMTARAERAIDRLRA